MSYNRVLLLGRLGKDPVLRHTQTGVAVASFSLATTERWKDKGGEQKEVTQWTNVVVWGKQGETVARYATKGSQVFVEGRLTSRLYTDQTLATKTITEVQADTVRFVGPKSDNSPGEGDLGLKPLAKVATKSLLAEEDIPF